MTEKTTHIAQLVPLGGKNGERDGTPVPVQFNPTTLNLQYTSHTGQRDKGTTLPRQYVGLRSTTLTVDLIFDTADLGTDVRELTTSVLAFFTPPKSKGGKSGPPRVRFEWGTFAIAGTVDSATEDLELFSPSGRPLRAKVKLTINGQERKVRNASISPSDGDPAATDVLGEPSQPPDPLKPDPTVSPTGERPDRAGPALAGESAPAFAARAGLDPRAWRSVALGASDPMALEPGQRLGFPSSAAPPTRPSNGFDVRDTVEIPGVENRSGASRSVGTSQPLAVQGAGGAGRAIESAVAAVSAAAAGAAREDFGLLPLTRSAQTALPPLADRRAVTYGLGVPLRPHFAPQRTHDRADRAWVVFADKRRWLAQERSERGGGS